MLRCTFENTGRLESNFEFEIVDIVRNGKLQRAVASGAEHADNNAVHKITHEIQSGQRIKTGQERSENEGKNRKFKQLEVKEQVWWEGN